MTDILRDARSKMQSKAERFIAGDKPGKVDCSDYTPDALDVESNEKNSGEPNNPRMRYKRGGTVVAAEGDRPKVNAGKKPRASGGAAKSLAPINGPIKSIYGNSNVSRELNKPLSEKQVMADNLRRSRDASRTERAAGGRTKGKTNINIIIGAGKGRPQPGGQPPMVPPIGAAPVAPPPDGALPPQGAPAPAAPPPMGMPRKDGGRTIKMEYGAGSGKGRLEKADKY